MYILLTEETAWWVGKMDETGFDQNSEEEEETRKRKTNEEKEKERRLEKIMRVRGRGKGGRWNKKKTESGQ